MAQDRICLFLSCSCGPDDHAAAVERVYTAHKAGNKVINTSSCTCNKLVNMMTIVFKE